MSAPRLEIDLKKLVENAQIVKAFCLEKGVNLTVVTKAVCGSMEIVESLLANGFSSFAESRIANLQRIRQSGLDAQLILLRSPMLSEVKQVVAYADISLNTELSVIRRLDKQALKTGKTHAILLMLELGDLREGILPSDLSEIVQEILTMEGIKLLGLGTNLACFGGVAPSAEKMRQLSAIAWKIEEEYDLNLEIVSGGNSANYQWLMSGEDLGATNHLRIGEMIFLGRETLAREPVLDLHTDVFTLVAELIEHKVKASKPYGELAQNVFGHRPAFNDLGERPRAILAVGEQDLDISGITPRLDAKIIGATSDHLILDAFGLDLDVGDEVAFDLNYSALLRAFTSPFVEKKYLK